MNDDIREQLIADMLAALKVWEAAKHAQHLMQKAFLDASERTMLAQSELRDAEQALFRWKRQEDENDPHQTASKLLNKILDDPALLEKLLPPVCTCTSLLGQRDPQCPVHGGK